MAVIDLSTRITKDWEKFQQSKSSSDSYIYISPDSYKLDDGPASVDFMVGDTWFLQNSNQQYMITDSGIALTPHQSILIETKEEIALPDNAFGLVTGKGLRIFRGTFISTGKIDPGFIGKLKIGIYNGSDKEIQLKKGVPLCTCVFFEMETNLPLPKKKKTDNSDRKPKPIGKKEQTKLWIKENYKFVSTILSIIAIFISMLALFSN